MIARTESRTKTGTKTRTKTSQQRITLAVVALGVAFTAVAFLPGSSARALAVRRAETFIRADQGREPAKTQTFTGVIDKKGDRFILTDDSTKSSYLLDDQDSAQKFAGKRVRVKGVLDATNETIRVETIEIAAAHKFQY